MGVDFKKIYEARQEIKKLIKEKPELQKYQDFIDEELRKAGDNPHNRCAVLENMLREKQRELIDKLQELKKEVNKFGSLAAKATGHEQ